MSRLALPALLLLGACVVDGGEATPLPLDDLDRFEAEVQPVFARTCSNPSCHGQAGRPLSLYAPQRWREDPERLFLDEPLSEAELRHNLACAGTFVVEVADALDCALLTKPLDPEAGGETHGGGTQFADTEEPDFQALLAWVEDVLATEAR